MLENILAQAIQFDFLLRTRLTNIEGFSHLLEDQHTQLSPAQQWEYAEIVKASSETLQMEIRRFVFHLRDTGEAD